MRINLYHDTKGICHITVMGEIESSGEEAYFLELLQAVGYKAIHITFLDANIIGFRVIEALGQMQSSGEIKLFVLKPYLFSYLFNLGISSSFIVSKLHKNKRAKAEHKISFDEIGCFLQDIKKCYGYDYTQYQIESISRRINICMLREGIKSFHLFREAVLQNEQIFEQLFLHLSVNTTEFFRNPEVYREIKNKIVPYLSTFPHIKIWCAGCSTGQEPYSLAILLKEAGLLNRTQIYATDINPFVVEEAKNGLYPLKGLENSMKNYKEYGSDTSFMDNFILKRDYIEIDEKLKKNILFFQHSLDSSGILNEFQLILCRNVLIYFNSKLQNKVLETFSNSLDRNGFLVLGKSEGILHNGGNEHFYEVNKQNRIYKKKLII